METAGFGDRDTAASPLDAHLILAVIVAADIAENFPHGNTTIHDLVQRPFQDRSFQIANLLLRQYGKALAETILDSDTKNMPITTDNLWYADFKLLEQVKQLVKRTDGKILSDLASDSDRRTFASQRQALVHSDQTNRPEQLQGNLITQLLPFNPFHIMKRKSLHGKTSPRNRVIDYNFILPLMAKVFLDANQVNQT
jgi:hypothetical protein